MPKQPKDKESTWRSEDVLGCNASNNGMSSPHRSSAGFIHNSKILTAQNDALSRERYQKKEKEKLT